MNMHAHDLSPDDILIVGVGMTPVGEHWDLSIRELALHAISAAREEAGGLRPEAMYAANMLSPALTGQSHLATLLADFAGLRGIEAMTVEAAGASGGLAFRQAYLALRSGILQTALVVGVEKVTDRVSSQVDAALATTTDADYEAIQGVTPIAQAAMVMRRYLHEYDAPDDALGGFSMTAHANAVHNPNAMFRKAIKPELYQRAGKVNDPINMFDAAPIADGAAALLLARADILTGVSDKPMVRVRGSAASTSALALHDQGDPLFLQASADSAQRAFASAKLKPADVDFAELHDRFTILAALSLEAIGFAERGQGWTWAANGKIGLQGELPILTFGGSKARGDVGGATGVIQIGEVVRQLQGAAGEIQVADAKIGLAQCLGGFGATAATHILERVVTT